MIHTREAWDDTFAMLDGRRRPATDRVPLLHRRRARGASVPSTLGAYLSFSGIVTFPSADDVRAAAAICPLDRLLVETDAPYLAPVPHRGQPNRPAWCPWSGPPWRRSRIWRRRPWPRPPGTTRKLVFGL